MISVFSLSLIYLDKIVNNFSISHIMVIDHTDQHEYNYWFIRVGNSCNISAHKSDFNDECFSFNGELVQCSS